MSEQPILITQLNDFIFCPVSIYFHSLDEDTDKILYQDSVQLNGSAAHKKSDPAEYSTKKNILQGISVYSEKYNLIGKKRAKFNKYIRKLGHMLQYSVYEIDNSERMLNNIVADLNNKWVKIFDESDSVYIFQLSKTCKIQKYGFAKHEDSDLIIIK